MLVVQYYSIIVRIEIVFVQVDEWKQQNSNTKNFVKKKKVFHDENCKRNIVERSEPGLNGT